MQTGPIKGNKVELIVGSVIEQPAPRAQTRDFIVLKTPLCDTHIHLFMHT